jgi:hypothetical protein
LDAEIRPFFSLSAVATFVEWLGSLIFDAIVVATPHIALRFPESKTVIVQNFPVIDELESSKAQPYVTRSDLVTYIGIFATKRASWRWWRRSRSYRNAGR